MYFDRIEPTVEEEKFYTAGIGLIKVEVVNRGAGAEELMQVTRG